MTYGESDPLHYYGICNAQEIKGTPGITAWYVLRVLIDAHVRDLDVGSTYPPAESGGKGGGVHSLRRYASWVQTDVNQVGPYPDDNNTLIDPISSTRGPKSSIRWSMNCPWGTFISYD